MFISDKTDVRVSGVLAASIERSRQSWLVEGIFERYWVKPSKKKNQTDLQNPAKESMSKLGSCSMIIEPHVFEVTLYTVRDTQYTFLPPMSQPLYPTPPPLANNGSIPGSGLLTHPIPSMLAAQPLPQISPPQVKPQSQTVLPPFREGFGHLEPQGLSVSPSSHSPIVPRTLSSPGSGKPAPSTRRGSSSAIAQDSTANSDPVIQMLAARAATNHELKSLMKLVAQGSASREQLEIFQSHIDELNTIIQARKKGSAPEATSQSVPLEVPQRIAVPVYTTSTQPAHITNAQKGAASTTILPVVGIKSEPLSQYYSQPPQYLRVKGPVPTRQDVSAVVFDFTAGAGDRYLLPKYSILEYLPGNTEVLISFLITRKGNSASGGKYKDNVDYYQPVTMRLFTQNPRILEPLARVVVTVEEARRHMTDIMSKMTLADEVYLITRLPRTQEDTTVEKRESRAMQENEVLKSTYPPPTSILPMYSARKV